jgi:soluble lytic murein transglycosylase-like protein
LKTTYAALWPLCNSEIVNVAMQHIQNTFGTFTEALHPDIGGRVEDIPHQRECPGHPSVLKERTKMKNVFAGLLAAAFSAALVITPAHAGSQAQVQALIKQLAPSYGVPTWFALRIAKIESGYNANARGAHGELGTFQMKCQTAKGIGYRGSCNGLLDPRTGVEVGLRHLALAIKSSGGNLKLAASKHNGGLGRKTIVKKYVAQVF